MTVAAGLGLVGLAIGSFLNVVAHRVPAGASIVRPGSACPACGLPIRPTDNIPVVSWILLRGRCRHCGISISPLYPVVEALTGILFGAAVLVVGLRWVLPAYLVFAATTLVLTVTDFQHHRIPNRILYPATGISVGLLAVGAVADGAVSALGRGLLGGVVYFVLLFVTALAARGGFGFGDVKLAFLLGTFLAFRGWGTLAVGIFTAIALGGLAGLILLAAGRRGRKDAIAYGPALVLGSWIAIAFGERLFAWYLS